MNIDAQHILTCLQAVSQERALRAADARLAARVAAVKEFQHARFASTYGDMLAHPRYAGAARFFLDELYGEADFTQRDAQFARVVPALARLFPAEIVKTVGQLAELHALSEQLDSVMGAALGAVLGAPSLDAATYGVAWRRVARASDRERQIGLMLGVGSSLDTLTRKPLLRHTLRLMRAPARAAGLEALQSFLERGFDTFREMNGADEFLLLISMCERHLAEALFACPDVAKGTQELN